MVIKITWIPVDGASGYYIYRKTASGSYTRIKTITSNTTSSYVDQGVADKNGITYYYKVAAYSGTVKSPTASKKTVRLTGKAISSLSNVATRRMLVKWTRDSKVTGYQIQYSTSSTFASGNKTVSITSNSTLYKYITSLTKGKKYYVRLRTYKTVSGVKYYSGWSTKKYITITK